MYRALGIGPSDDDDVTSIADFRLRRLCGGGPQRSKPGHNHIGGTAPPYTRPGGMHAETMVGPERHRTVNHLNFRQESVQNSSYSFIFRVSWSAMVFCGATVHLRKMNHRRVLEHTHKHPRTHPVTRTHRPVTRTPAPAIPHQGIYIMVRFAEDPNPSSTSRVLMILSEGSSQRRQRNRPVAGYTLHLTCG